MFDWFLARRKILDRFPNKYSKLAAGAEKTRGTPRSWHEDCPWLWFSCF